MCEPDCKILEEPAVIFVQCPICGELRTRDPRSHVTCNPQKVFCPPLLLPGDVEFDGVRVVQEFLSEDQEQVLVQAIDTQPWTESQSGRRKQVGVASIEQNLSATKSHCRTMGQRSTLRSGRLNWVGLVVSRPSVGSW